MPAAMSQTDTPTRGSVLGAIHRAEPALRLDKKVIGFLLAVGPVAAIPGDRTANQRRMLLQKIFESESHAFHRAGGEVLDKDVSLGDHCGEYRLVGGILQVEANRFLAAIQPDEIGAVAIHQRIIPPGEIALGALDLDHRAPASASLLDA